MAKSSESNSHWLGFSFLFVVLSALIVFQLLSRVWHSETPWTAAHQTPLSMGFPRQEYWSGLPCPSPGDLPNPGVEPRSPALQADSFNAEPSGKSRCPYSSPEFFFWPKPVSKIQVLVVFDYNFTLNQCSFPVDTGSRYHGLINHITKLQLYTITNFFVVNSFCQEAS